MSKAHYLVKLPRLVEGVILERTSLFTVKIRIGRDESIVYLNNTGKLRGVIEKSRVCYYISNSAKAKTRLRLIGVREREKPLSSIPLYGREHS